MWAERAGAKIGNTIRKPNTRAPGISQSSDNKTAKKWGLAGLQGLEDVHNCNVGNFIIKILRSPSASPFEEERGERRGAHNCMEYQESLFLGFAFGGF